MDSLKTLLSRNLHEVFGENDAERRRRTIDEIFAEDAIFHAPGGVYRGRDAIDRIAGEIRAGHPDYRYSELREPEILQETAGRIQWVSGLPGEDPEYAGTDIIVARDGRIVAIYLFFDPLPGQG